MNYQNSKIFMESVKNNEVFSIKSTLESLIVLFKGDKVKCDEAVEYAINNSSFNWEDDDGVFFGEGLNTAKEKYCYEKERLVQNFTKERYLNVLELYKQYDREELKKEEKQPDSPMDTSFKNSNNQTFESGPKRGPKSGSRPIRSNRGMDQEDKIVFQRMSMLGLGIIVIVWLLIKIIF